MARISQDRRVEPAKRRDCDPLGEQRAGRAVGLPLIFIGYSKPPPNEDQDWWKTLHDDEGCDDGVMPAGWWRARIDHEWWKTATPDS